MISFYVSAIIIGTCIGILYTLLYISFDKAWKKIGSFLTGIGGGTGLIIVNDKNNFT